MRTLSTAQVRYFASAPWMCSDVVDSRACKFRFAPLLEAKAMHGRFVSCPVLSKCCQVLQCAYAHEVNQKASRTIPGADVSRDGGHHATTSGQEGNHTSAASSRLSLGRLSHRTSLDPQHCSDAIVSLLPSGTEILFALGLEHRQGFCPPVVGVTAVQGQRFRS